MIEVILLAIGFAAFGLWSIWGKGKTAFKPPKISAISPQMASQYSAVDSLFVNRAELAFFHALRRAVPDNLLVLSKVRMEDIVRVAPSVKDQRQKWALRGRVKSRHVDYLITSLTGEPLCVIELDGSAHSSRRAQVNDSVKDAIFMACNLPIRRVRVGEDFAERIDKICRNFG